MREARFSALRSLALSSIASVMPLNAALELSFRVPSALERSLPSDVPLRPSFLAVPALIVALTEPELGVEAVAVRRTGQRHVERDVVEVEPQRIVVARELRGHLQVAAREVPQ